MVMTTKRSSQAFSTEKPFYSTLLVLVLWQSMTASNFFICAADDATPSLRRANITTTKTNYNHCDTKCVTLIDSGSTTGCIGRAGDDCSFPYEICPDTVTQCFGPLAVCVDNFGNYPGYHCDCRMPKSASVVEDMIAQDYMLIDECFDRVTEVCEKDQKVSTYAFCTNGGRCSSHVGPGEPHPGCFCPGRFVGRHCEKRRGTGAEYRMKPTPTKVDEVKESPTQEDDNRRIGTSMSLLVVVLPAAFSVLLVSVAALYKRFRSQQNASSAEEVITKTETGINNNIS